MEVALPGVLLGTTPTILARRVSEWISFGFSSPNTSPKSERVDRFRFPKKGTAANEAEFLSCQSFHKKSTPRRSQHGSGAEPLLPHCGRRLAKGRIGGPGRACTRGRKCVARFSDRTASASERPTQQDPLGPRTPGYWPAIKKLQGNQPGVLGHVNTFQIAPSLTFRALKEAILECDQPGCFWTSSGHGRDPHARASGSY